jgi:hypothetical protein
MPACSNSMDSGVLQGGAGVHENKPVTLGGLLLRTFIYSLYIWYSIGVEVSYIISYLSSLRSVPYKHLTYNDITFYVFNIYILIS